MRLLSNLIALRMLLLLIAGGMALFFGIALMRRLRRGLVEEATLPTDFSSSDALPLETYSAVIQQLKQQKHELHTAQQAEKRRAKASEMISASILSSLSSGVLFFTSNGLVRQANPAARQILCFSSPLGMSADEIFRQATASAPDGSRRKLASLIVESLAQKSSLRHLEAEYTTPAGSSRVFDLNLTAVQSATGEFFGLTCLLNDQTEVRNLRACQSLHEEASLAAALELRSSLAAISGYAQNLSQSADLASARQSGADIISEAKHLEDAVGGFLTNSAAKAAAGD